MITDEFAAFIFFMTALIGGLGLAALRMKLKWRERDKLGSSQEDLERMTDAIDGLADQVAALTDENANLQDRLDFAERVLTKPVEPSASTTPV